MVQKPLLQILYEDNHLLGVLKPAGVSSQPGERGVVSILELAKQYLKEAHKKPGNVYIGLVHRLDRNVSGVMVLAKTSKAAGRLSEQFRSRGVRKIYLALVDGIPPQGLYEDMLGWNEESKVAKVVEANTAGAKRARLDVRVFSTRDDRSLVRVELETGRKHQIRVQLSHRGHPIVGDIKYGADEALPDRQLALVAESLEFSHPVRPEQRIQLHYPNEVLPEIFK